MAEYPLMESFIVRVYRYDTEDCRKIIGLVEAMDGSGESEAFTDLDALGGILNRYAARVREQRKKDT